MGVAEFKPRLGHVGAQSDLSPELPLMNAIWNDPLQMSQLIRPFVIEQKGLDASKTNPQVFK